MISSNGIAPLVQKIWIEYWPQAGQAPGRDIYDPTTG
jgi:hypothetical protein